MTKEIFNVIKYPYDEMLLSLSNLKGYGKYIDWLHTRVKHDLSWRSEIKGLFEVNKPEHPIQEISSHKEGEPEGTFGFANLKLTHLKGKR